MLLGGAGLAGEGRGLEFDYDGEGAGCGGWRPNGDAAYAAAQHPAALAALQYQQMMANATAYDPRDPANCTEALAPPEEELEKLPTTRQPSKLSTKLLPYQLQGLAWLLAHEHPTIPESDTKACQFWNKKGSSYRNKLTLFQTQTKPLLASGGILADDMGLGKTLQMISLIVADMSEHTDVVKASEARNFKHEPTLIVAPVSVMSNWTEQVRLFLERDYSLLTSLD